MVIDEPNCVKRRCAFFVGIVREVPKDKSLSPLTCAAYPGGIPYEIAFGDDPHDKVRPDQKNKIIFDRNPADAIH